MIGRTYLEKGRPVTVLVRSDWKRRSPRNVLIRREDGTKVVRPFRGLRKLAASTLFFALAASYKSRPVDNYAGGIRA